MFGSVRVVNDTPYRTRQMVFCGVAFPQGEVKVDFSGLCVSATSGERLGLVGHQSAIEPMGRLWKDGTVRFGRLLAVPRMDPNADELVPIGPCPAKPFELGAWAGLSAAINPRLTITKLDGSRIVSPLQIGAGKNLSQTAAGIVSEVRQRIPGTCLWWSLRTMLGSDCDAIPFRIRIHNSDPTRPAVREDWAEIRFDSDMPAQFPMRGKLGLVPSPAAGAFGPGYSISWKLSGPDWLADAQGLWFFDGVWPLIDPNVHPADEAERVEALQAAVTWPVLMWHDSQGRDGMHGPFGNPGHLPAGQTVVQADAAITARANVFRTNRTEIARWGDWDFAEAPDTAQTGEHETHGTALLAPQLLTSNPRCLPELILGSLGEARRPMHRYEADLSVVRKRNHPNLTYWSGNVHWVSVDKLGKGTAQATDVDKHYWSGPDPEHWMVEAFLGPVAQITADWDLLEMARQEMEQFKGHGDGQLGNFATRAQFWCSYSMAWWRLLLSEEVDDFPFVRGWQLWLVDWFRNRNQRGEGGWGAGPGPVRPTIVMKDQRYFWGPRLPDGTPDLQQLPPFWIVWQHQFVWGALALQLVDPLPAFFDMLTQVARSVDFNGWDESRGHPFGGVLWQAGGAPITGVVYVQDIWNQALGIWQKTEGTVTSDVGTDWGIWAEGGRLASLWMAGQVQDIAWLARLDQIGAWIQAIVASQSINAAKIARWSGSMPVVAPVI